MDCPHCQTSNPELARFCSGCGMAFTVGPALEAERRQLAVVFCDLAGSTELAARLDPEDFSAIIRRYHERCSETIRGLAGHVAQCLGDGVLAYFGYPVSHENDALLAVRAGLRLVAAVKHLNTELRVGYGIELSVRVGIHAGVVVMADVGIGPRRERLALGSVPNLAARIQGVAAPDTVLISEEVQHLVAGYIHANQVSGVRLRGFEGPATLYEVTGETLVQSRFDVTSAGSLTPFVGNQIEIDRMLSAWHAAEGGQFRAFVLEGDAGIGKSRRVHMLKDALKPWPHRRLELQCAPETSQSALYPVAVALREQFLSTDDATGTPLERLERALADGGVDVAEALPLVAPLLSVPLDGSSYGPPDTSPFKARDVVLRALLALLAPSKSTHPSLVIIEDLHWADASTLDLVQMMLNQPPEAPALVVLTRRSDSDWSPPPTDSVETLVVRKLTRLEARRVAAHVAGSSALPTGSLDALLERSDGVPLFVEELTKTLLETGMLAQDPAVVTEPDVVDEIPPSVRGLLGSRLDRMGGAKAVMQLGAVLGREFQQDVLEAVSPLVGLRVRDHLRELLRAGMLFAGDSGALSFRHALIRDAAYGTLMKATRRQYHERTGDVLVEKFPSLAAAQPELVAQHYDRAARPDRAVTFWISAGQRALATNAAREATSHAQAGLFALAMLNESPEQRRWELELRALLGMALVATEGYASASAEQNFTRAEHVIRALSEATSPAAASDYEKQFVTTWCVWAYRLVRSELESSNQSADHLHALAHRMNSSDLAMRAHCSRGITYFYLADGHERALREFELALSAYDDDKHRGLAARLGEDPKTVCLSYVLWIDALTGNAERARERLNEALAHAERCGHRFSEAYLAAHAAALFYLLRDERACEEQALRAIAISERYGFPAWLGVGGMHRGWVKLLKNEVGAGLDEIRANNGMLDAISILLYGPTRAEALSQALEANGDVQGAKAVIEQAIERAEQTSESWYLPELLRRQALLERALGGDLAAAFETLERALSVARKQGSRLLELRTATALASLRSNAEQARQLLMPLLESFSPACRERDVTEARELLARLSEGRSGLEQLSAQ